MATVTRNDVGDIVYVRLAEGPVAETRDFGDHRLVDFDAAGAVIGAEFIGVEQQIDLRGLPSGDRLSEAIASADGELEILSDLLVG
jgi:uncharacterized protein YuzE